MRAFLIVLILLGLLSDSSASESPRNLPLASLERLLQSVIDIRSNVNLANIDAQLFEALQIGYRQGLNIESRGTHFLRKDSYHFREDWGHATIDGLAFPFTISGNKEVTFIRRYSSASAAAKAQVPHINELPLTAAKAISMSAGEVVEIPIRAEFAIKLSARLPTSLPRIVATGDLIAAIRGKFIIQVAKDLERNVHLRVIQQLEEGRAERASLSTSITVFNRKHEVAIRLTGEEARGYLLRAHYCLNLRSIEAREAYEDLLSKPIRVSELANANYVHDLSELDDLACSSESVQRIESSLLEYRKKKHSLSFSLPCLHIGLSGEWWRNELKIKNLDGSCGTYIAALHKSSAKTSFIGTSSSERTCGFLLKKGEPNEFGPYWFRWSRSYAPWNTYCSAADQFAYVLGPLKEGLELETTLSKLKKPRWQRLSLIVSEKAVKILFKKGLVSELVIARSISQMVKSLDHKFLIPYNNLPCKKNTQTPLEAPISEVSSLKDELHQKWGRYYAEYLVGYFLPTLIDLQKENDTRKQMQFFADFLDDRLLTNEYGAILLTRFFVHIFIELGLTDYIYCCVEAGNKESNVQRCTGLKCDWTIINCLMSATSPSLF